MCIRDRKIANKHMTFGYHPVGTPTCLHKQEVGKPSWNAVQPCTSMQGYANDDLRADGLQKGWGFRVSTWNVDSLTGRSGEVVEALSDRKVDMAYIQETRWKCSGCNFYGANAKRYKLFWMGGEEKLDDVGIFVAGKWVDSVVNDPWGCKVEFTWLAWLYTEYEVVYQSIDGHPSTY